MTTVNGLPFCPFCTVVSEGPKSTMTDVHALITSKQKQVVEQCRVIAKLAQNIMEIHADLAKLYASSPKNDSLLEMIGRQSANRMETLGDILNNMDAVADEDAWMADIYEKAHDLWPQLHARSSSDS